MENSQLSIKKVVDLENKTQDKFKAEHFIELKKIIKKIFIHKLMKMFRVI